MDLLEGMSALLSYEGANQLEKTHKKLLVDEFVRKEDLIPSLGAVRRFFDLVRLAVVYMRWKYGEKTTPRTLEIWSSVKELDGVTNPFFIAYKGGLGVTTDDHILITRLYIARHCVHFDDGTITNNDHLPAGYGVHAPDHVVLAVVEELYHRYQVHAQEKKPRERITYDRTDPMEQEIVLVMQVAIADLRIKLYPR